MNGRATRVTPTRPRSRVIARILHDLLKTQTFPSVLALRQALTARLLDLHIVATPLDVDEAIQLVGSNTPLVPPAEPAEPAEPAAGTRRLEELDGLAPNDPERDEICKHLTPADERALMLRYGLPWPSTHGAGTRR